MVLCHLVVLIFASRAVTHSIQSSAVAEVTISTISCSRYLYLSQFRNGEKKKRLFSGHADLQDKEHQDSGKFCICCLEENEGTVRSVFFFVFSGANECKKDAVEEVFMNGFHRSSMEACQEQKKTSVT